MPRVITRQRYIVCWAKPTCDGAGISLERTTIFHRGSRLHAGRTRNVSNSRYSSICVSCRRREAVVAGCVRSSERSTVHLPRRSRLRVSPTPGKDWSIAADLARMEDLPTTYVRDAIRLSIATETESPEGRNRKHLVAHEHVGRCKKRRSLQKPSQIGRASGRGRG